MTEFNPAPPKLRDLDATGRLILALAASLALHLVLILGVQVRAVRQPGKPLPVMEVRIERLAGGVDIEAGRGSINTVRAEPVEARSPFDKLRTNGLQTSSVHINSVMPLAEPALPAAPVAEQAPSMLPTLEVPLIEDPTYYPAKQVDVHPKAVRSIKPAYPDKAAEQGIEGSVVLLLLIDEAGVVKEASVAEANPEGYFEVSTLAAFRNEPFKPAQKNGRAVKSRVLIRVTYELNGKK